MLYSPEEWQSPVSLNPSTLFSIPLAIIKGSLDFSILTFFIKRLEGETVLLRFVRVQITRKPGFKTSEKVSVWVTVLEMKGKVFNDEILQVRSNYI